MQIEKGLLAVLLAYLLGSIPTALLYSRWAHGQDIRCLGDGNMGARNSKRQFGWRAGVLVALADIVKGALAVQVAGLLGLPEVWHFLCGFFAVLGHDFPIFARFKGGQGFAATTGVFLSLFPFWTLVGFTLYTVLFLTTRRSDLAASIGMGTLAAAEMLSGASLAVMAFIIGVLLLIPAKKWLDRKRGPEIAAGRTGVN